MMGYKPIGMAQDNSKPVYLLFEEYEAMRLIDYKKMNHEQAAEVMNVSRPTFTRIYEKARRTIADAFIEGRMIFIEGGDIETDRLWYRCGDCYEVSVSRREINECLYCESNNIIQMTLFSKSKHHLGGAGNCICLTCGTRVPHKQGIACKS
jgi:predicted DNA-binding protein (UPF0251 family)